MKKLLILGLALILSFLCLTISCSQQTLYQDPVDAVNVLFKVAETKDFKMLGLICDLDKLELIEEGSSKDSDACGVCLLENSFVSECSQNSANRDDFVDLFQGGYVNGDVQISSYEDIKFAEVPVILFRKNNMIKETIVLFQHNESKGWYFADF